MAKNKFLELEDVILNQIELLNDESLLRDKAEAEIAISKSRAISDLACQFNNIQRTKLDVCKAASSANMFGNYDVFLGIKSK